MKRVSVLSAMVVGACLLVSLQRQNRTSQPTETGADSNSTPIAQTDHRASKTSKLALPLVDPKIVVIKSKRLLQLHSGGAVVRTYRVGLGLNPVQDKRKQGDRCTPEGEFFVCLKNSRSQFYLSLELSYPNQEHAERGLREGLIGRTQYDQIVNAIRRRRAPPQDTAMGGQIFIHGSGSSSDWTWGCVALDNRDIRELFDAVPVGTSVTIEH